MSKHRAQPDALNNHGFAGLRVDELTVSYGGPAAIRAVSLGVRRGEIVAVTGPSGAGKTTLLTALAGLLPIAGGRIDHLATPAESRRAVPPGIALVPQSNALVSTLTALENVLLPLLAAGQPSSEAYAATRQALTSTGLDDAAGQLVDELSGGQQQRVAVARAVARQSDLLLADEPTSALDSGNRNNVMQLLREQAARGAAVIVTTHDPEAADVCDAELHLDEGVGHWRRDDR